jgi:MFS family permease
MTRSVLFPLGLGTALSLMGDATLYTVLPTQTAAAGISLASVGLLLGINRAVRLVFNSLAGRAYDRLPRRRLFVSSLFIGALSTALCAATRGLWPLLAGRVLWGLAWSGIWIGGTMIILDVTDAHDRGRLTGLYNTWFFAGAALGALAGGFLTDHLGYAAAMWIGAGVTAFGGLVALLLLPETRGLRRQPDEIVVEPDAPRPPHRPGRGLWLAAAMQGVNRFVTAGVLMATLALLVEDRLGPVGELLGVGTVTGVLMAGRTSLSIVAAPVAGAASDRLGSRWRVAGWLLVAGAAAMILLGLPPAAAILAGIGLAAVAGGGIQVLATTLTGDLAGEAGRGRSLGWLNTAGDLGSALGPLVAYALLPWIGLPAVYWLCAALFAVQWLLVLVWQTPRP